MKNSRRARSKFERWVLNDAGGTKELSLKLDVSQTAVQHWCAKRASPNLSLVNKILILSNGKLSISDILNGTSKQ